MLVVVTLTCHTACFFLRHPRTTCKGKADGKASNTKYHATHAVILLTDSSS